MKKRILALLCALALTVGLAGCVLSTPDTVGTIGDVEISSGLYLLAQFDAYQKAADLASSEQDASKVKSFLKETITVDADTEETATVSDYVAQQTLKNLETYAAIETRFDALGGQLTAEQEAQADSYAEQLMNQYGDTYKANGIGLETVKRFERILLKSTVLLDLVYGENGETPVSDADLTNYIENDLYYLSYVAVPLYNTTSYAFADDSQKALMLELAQGAMSSYNPTRPATAAAQQSAFQSAATAVLPDLYDVTATTDDPADASFSTSLLSDSDLDTSFTADGSADAIRALQMGEATAVQYSTLAMMMAVRLDPLQMSTLDTLRATALSDMKSAELQDALAEYGASLPHSLDASAMSKLPAKKIVNNSANSANRANSTASN